MTRDAGETTMPANPINQEVFKKVLASNVDGTQPRRYSIDPARKRFYASSRSKRYSRYLNTLGS